MRFGVIGAGNMAGAILAAGIREGAVGARETRIYDINRERAARLAAEYGVIDADRAEDVASECDVVLLGVHPNEAAGALRGLDFGGGALISIVTGFDTAALKAAAPSARALRVMPNLPAFVSEGMTVFAKNHSLSENELEFALSLFRAVGEVEWIEERLLSAAIGLCGSGPAYAFLFVEALADGGVAKGLPRQLALRLAAQTLLGAAKLAATDGRHPGELKDAVASPGGTTIAAIRALEARGFRSAVIEAVIASAERADALS